MTLPVRCSVCQQVQIHQVHPQEHLALPIHPNHDRICFWLRTAFNEPEEQSFLIRDVHGARPLPFAICLANVAWLRFYGEMASPVWPAIRRVFVKLQPRRSRLAVQGCLT